MTEFLASAATTPVGQLNLLEVLQRFDYLYAVQMTLWLALWSALWSLVIGTLVAILRLSPVPTLNWVGTAWVTVMRNTPLTLIVIAVNLILFIQLAYMWGDSDTTFLRYAILALALYHSAFVCEALRSGVNTIPLGQAEAARSIGLTFAQSLRMIILPQAFRGAITPLGNVLIALTKNTTVVTAVGVFQITAAMNNINEMRADLIVPIFLVVAATFVIITLPMGVMTGYLSKRLAVKR